MAVRKITIRTKSGSREKNVDHVLTDNNFTDALKLKLETMTGGSLTTEQLNAITEDVLNNIDLSIYVQKVTGKGLSTEDYTTLEKNKLSSLTNGLTQSQIRRITQ